MAWVFSFLCMFACFYITFEENTKFQNENVRYRLSGALLFLNWDSIRANVNIPDLLSKNFGEIIRKADGIFQRSEIKGTITINLPNGEKYTVLQRSQYDSFAFAEPKYFSVEFIAPRYPELEEFTINCDLEEEDDTSENDVVCQGSKSYRARKSNRDQKQMQSNANLMGKLNNNKNNDDKIDLVKLAAEFMKNWGYDKLYSPTGAKDIEEVLKMISKFDFEHPSLISIINLLEGISGVFLEGLSIGMVSQDISELADYKRVSDAWSISDSAPGYDDVHGQLYLLPQAFTLTITEILSLLNVEFEIPEKMRDLELPFIEGPAFPLFDMSRAQLSVSDFSQSPGWDNPISAYISNTYKHKYVIFSSLWDSDGDHIFDLDDCLAKGNALGFDTIDWTSQTNQLSKCDYVQDISIVLKQKEIVQMEHGTDLTEYELSGIFDLFCNDDAGSHYEPFGELSISIGERSINKLFKVWHFGADTVEVKNNQHYIQPFVIRFSESKNLMDTTTKVTLHGNVKEYDSTSGDDLIGDYNGASYEVNSFKELRKFVFYGEESNRVSISLQLLSISGEQEIPNLIQYQMSGVFDFWCADDAGSYYEPYGKFSMDLGNRKINQEYLVWQATPGQTEIRNGDHFLKHFKKVFKEIDNFLDAIQSTSVITLNGKVMEDDDSSGDDLIGNYDKTSIIPHELTNLKSYKFNGDNAGVEISLRVQKVEDIPPSVEYQLSGKFKFICYSDAGSSYEPKGRFSVSIGDLAENQNLLIWSCNADDMEVANGQSWSKDFIVNFEEADNFMVSKSEIVLHGSVMEDDSSSGDDLIGKYDGATYAVSSLSNSKEYTFPGEDGSWVKIKLQIGRRYQSRHQEF